MTSAGTTASISLASTLAVSCELTMTAQSAKAAEVKNVLLCIFRIGRLCNCFELMMKG